ncbi:MAG: OadG family protein [Planctomycetaceae bacterium]|nr:OadG family protein [Planctomycetales bacterium]MCB9939256.1 OadG family protein [Planctomycetaceae bacterium]
MLLAQQNGRPLFEFTLSPLFEDHGLPLAIMGVLVVYTALSLIVLFITLLPRMLGGSVTKASKPAIAQQVVADQELSEEALVVIAAAVAESISTPHRIVKIRGLTPADLGWSLEGRTQHHQSHRLHERGG